MLGEKFSEIQGKVIGTRVIQNNDGSVKLETSFQGVGKIYGIDTTDLGTYTACLTPAGTLQGEGQGVSMTKDGEGIQWKGHGVGKPTGKGFAASWRVSIYYQTTSQKLAKLNGLLAVGEWEVDENGNAKGASWEWR